MVYVPLTPMNVAVIARMYANGHFVKDIAQDIGASCASIYKHLSLLKAGKVGPGKDRPKKITVTQEQAHMDWLAIHRFTTAE